MKTIEGDLLALAQAGHFDVIIHGCNCQCRMGRGIALSIKNTFPDAYKADLKTKKGAQEKLGTYSYAEITSNDASFTVVNAYTQFHWRGEGDLADYEAIRSVMRKIKTDFSGKRIGYPLIGAGLAGGNWERIAAIIGEELQGEDHTLVKWNGASA
ncbi:predicted phosphatase [Hahella chejuensis KCTC 2396]|uniref:Predicted phosphatase n=1 Tax=Hahella chejuensis (strain KCTC 2396) TaxID=349521 RepID=Q2SJU4_HAHCH|nr:macro domain-containing protein [Hahella chejuensis]ABC29080.1 predicted phosphatase [Hahella chejuensis KCTC 2396]